MKRRLSKVDGGRISDGPKYGTGPSYRYEVQGLPPDERADIARFDRRWRILRIKNGIQGEWTGDYATADEALDTLQKEFE